MNIPADTAENARQARPEYLIVLAPWTIKEDCPPCPLSGKFFFDRRMGWSVLVDDASPSFSGWIARWGQHGQWVTVREATDDDRECLAPVQCFREFMRGENV